MWFVEHSVDTSASAQAVWRLWSDVERRPEWNPGVERIELRGPFAVGSTILMTPPGDEPVEARIAEATEPELFVDEADGGDFVVRTTHRVAAVGDDPWRITYRMQITGAGRRDRGVPRSAPRSAAISRRCSQHWPRAPRAREGLTTPEQAHSTGRELGASPSRTRASCAPE